MISEVRKLETGKILVFDEKGEQMPEFQGKYEDVRIKILTRAPRGTKFFHGDWPGNPVPRKDW